MRASLTPKPFTPYSVHVLTHISDSYNLHNSRWRSVQGNVHSAMCVYSIHSECLFNNCVCVFPKRIVSMFGSNISRRFNILLSLWQKNVQISFVFGTLVVIISLQLAELFYKLMLSCSFISGLFCFFKQGFYRSSQ